MNSVENRLWTVVVNTVTLESDSALKIGYAQCSFVVNTVKLKTIRIDIGEKMICHYYLCYENIRNELYWY